MVGWPNGRDWFCVLSGSGRHATTDEMKTHTANRHPESRQANRRTDLRTLDGHEDAAGVRELCHIDTTECVTGNDWCPGPDAYSEDGDGDRELTCFECALASGSLPFTDDDGGRCPYCGRRGETRHDITHRPSCMWEVDA